MAENPRVPKKILIFQKGSVAPSVGFDGKKVLSRLEELRDIELVGRAAVLGESDLLAVHPDVIGRIDTLETKEDGSVLPFFGHGERSAVGRNGVVVLVHVRRRSWVWIDDVAVDGDTKPPHLHAARDLDVVPFRVVESQAKEVPWP